MKTHFILVFINYLIKLQTQITEKPENKPKGTGAL